MTFRASDQEVRDYFSKHEVAVNIHRLPYQDAALRYLETGLQHPSPTPILFFVHGAPGSSSAFHSYLADSLLVQKARLLALDRKGYGYSDYGNAAPSLAQQSRQIKSILDQYPGAPAILIGHSFGGPIVAQAALDYPDRLKAIVMLAPVNDPDSEKVFWFSGFAKWGITRWMFSKAWRVSAVEKFAHIQELQQLQPRWDEIQVPVVHMHGAKDKMLAPPENIEFSKEHIPAQYLKMIVLPEAGHLIPWKNFEQVRAELIRLIPDED